MSVNTTDTDSDSESTTESPVQSFVHLTGFRRDVLCAVAAVDAPNGLDIKAELEAAYEEIPHGRLYPNLDWLVEEGYLEKSQKDKRANEYQLTDRAWRQLRAHHHWTGEQLSTGGGA